MPSINSEQVGTVRVIRLRGAFVTDEAVALIERVLSACTPPTDRCVVVNWSGMEGIGSAGIGAIIKGEWELSRKGGHYRNCVFSKFMVDLIPNLKVPYDWNWNYFETEELAVHSCHEVPSGGAAGSGPTPEKE